MKVNMISKQRVFDGFFKIDELTLQFQKFDGAMSRPIRRLVFERGDSVAALIRNTDTKQLMFTHQFRAPCYEPGEGWITEIVAGMIDGDESPEDALRREVLEETGYRVRHSQPLGSFYLSPGGSSERIHLYYVEVDECARESAGGGVREEDEDIRLIEMEIAEAMDAVKSGRFMDAKTMLSLFFMKELLSGHE